MEKEQAAGDIYAELEEIEHIVEKMRERDEVCRVTCSAPYFTILCC